MINLIISLAAGIAAWVLSAMFLFESNMTGIWFFFLFFIICQIALNKMTAKKVMAIMAPIQSKMQNLQSLPSEQARANMLDKIVEDIKKAYAYKHYQFFLEQQLNGQIGQIYYVQKRFKEAEPYLKNVFMQNGIAICMYACILYRNKDEQNMIKQFEKAVKYSRKETMFWNLYAYCLCELKKRDEAIAVLNRCLTLNPGDKITTENVNALKNSEKGKINMRSYNEAWFQFWLDDPYEMQKAIQKQMLDKHSVVRSR